MRANVKYRRVKTLVKKCLEVSRLCNIKLNLLVFKSRGKFEQHFTDEDVALEDKLIEKIMKDSKAGTKRISNSDSEKGYKN